MNSSARTWSDQIKLTRKENGQMSDLFCFGQRSCWCTADRMFCLWLTCDGHQSSAAFTSQTSYLWNFNFIFIQTKMSKAWMKSSICPHFLFFFRIFFWSILALMDRTVAGRKVGRERGDQMYRPKRSAIGSFNPEISALILTFWAWYRWTSDPFFFSSCVITRCSGTNACVVFSFFCFAKVPLPFTETKCLCVIAGECFLKSNTFQGRFCR